MYRFLETIRCKDGVFQALDLHQSRLDRTFSEVWGQSAPWKISHMLPLVPPVGLFKCSLRYDRENLDWRVIPYLRQDISALKIKEAPHLDYHLKYSDRGALEALRGELLPGQEVLITQKGFLTDTTFCNIALFNGHSWITPRHCLLAGTQRETLLKQGVVQAGDISVQDICHFQKIALFNALMIWDERIELDTERISLD